MESTADRGPDSEAVRQLLSSTTNVGRVSGRQPLHDLLRWISRGRLGHCTGWPVVPRLTNPWQDTITVDRVGWRQRAANLADPANREGEFIFAVDYRVCRRCGLGWVEQPYTIPRYQRMGIASAGLAALRAEHPGTAWHTLGGHLGDSREFGPLSEAECEADTASANCVGMSVHGADCNRRGASERSVPPRSR